MFGRVGRQAVRVTAGVSTCLLGISVATLAVAGRTVKAPPPTAESEAAANAGPTMILGYDANTLFFVAVGAVAIFWFTLGGGRKPKISSD
jgi:hypothetical protein